MFVVYYGRGFSFLAAPGTWFRRVIGKPDLARRKTTAGLLALLLLAAGATAAGTARAPRRHGLVCLAHLPVQEGGRAKPLDTLARETLRALGNASSLTDPQTQEKLDPTAAYLVLLLTGQGWERPASAHHHGRRRGLSGLSGPVRQLPRHQSAARTSPPPRVVRPARASLPGTSPMPGTANPCC